MKQLIEFVPGQPVYRNTWKNENNHIRTNLYISEDRARQSASSNRHRHLYQEIAVVVYPEHCLETAPVFYPEGVVA